DSALVEYHLGAVRSYAWVVDRRSITVHELPAAPAVEQVARAYHEILSRDIEALDAAARTARASQTADLGRRLADLVWKPVAARVGSRRALIVADGVLQYVPFAALPTATGEPLLARHDVVYLPSASVFESLK